MEREKTDVLVVISIVLCVIFTILSAFTCYRSGTQFWGIHDPLMEGVISWDKEVNNGFWFMLVLCILKIFALLPGKKDFLYCIDVIVSVIRMLATIMLLVRYAVIEKYLGSMGGLGSGVAEVTAIGYIVLALACLILLIDIKIRRKKRKILENDD